jgi:hypothetical protein
MGLQGDISVKDGTENQHMNQSMPLVCIFPKVTSVSEENGI